MKKILALLTALLLLLSLTACGSAETADTKEALTRDGIPGSGSSAPSDPSQLDLDLSSLQQEEAFRELEHLNLDPSGMAGLRLRLTGEVLRTESHGKQFCYVCLRDEDGCVENLELRFPGDGSLPADFPQEGETITVWGVLDYYSTQRDGKDVNCAVLTDARLSRYGWDERD